MPLATRIFFAARWNNARKVDPVEAVAVVDRRLAEVFPAEAVRGVGVLVEDNRSRLSRQDQRSGGQGGN